MSNQIRHPAISSGFKKDAGLYTVQITYEGGWVSVNTVVARHLAADLLIWADRVDKLNEEEE